MKKGNRMIGALLAGMMILGLAGCGKMNTGGEETNFPYSWKEESRGTILLKLDGSHGPEDYRWNVTSTDETVLEVKVVKKERKGQITYRIKPLKEGSAQVVFSRQRDVASMTGTVSSSAEKDEKDRGTSDVNVDGVETSFQADDFDLQSYLIEDLGNGGVKEEEVAREVDSQEDQSEAAEAAEAASALQAASENYEEYLNRFRAKDMVGEITIRFDAETTGKKGKLKLSLILASTQEYKGVMQNDGASADYQLWEDANGTVRIRLPELEEAWSATWDGEYEEREDPGIPGVAVSKPELRDGKYIILEIEDEGIVEGAHCYTIKGYDKGTATIEFANPTLEKRLLIQVEISRNGSIEVLSHNMTVPQG